MARGDEGGCRGSRGFASLVQVILIVALAIASVPLAAGQGVCQEDPSLPHCTEPSVQVALPGTVTIPSEPLASGDPARVVVPVNVTYQGAEETTVSVRPSTQPPGIGISGASATVGPQATVTLEVEVLVDRGTQAGSYPVELMVNTSATNAQSATSQTVGTEVLVPWWTAGGRGWAWGTGPGLHLEIRVMGFRANGPLDLLVTSPGRTAKPDRLVLGEALAAGDSVTREWIVALSGDVEDVTFDVWFVVDTPEGMACIDEASRSLVPVDGDGPPDQCQRLVAGSFGTTGQIGGWVGTLVLIVMGLVLLGMVGAAALGVFVLRRAGGQAPAWALGSYLLLTAVGFAPMALRFLLQELLGFGAAFAVVPGWTVGSVIVIAVALAGAVLTFALSYPTVHPRLRGSRTWLAIPLVPTVGIGAVLLFVLAGSFRQTMPVAMTVGMGYLMVSALTAGALFWHRARVASTDLERRRLRFMVRSVGWPLILGASATFALMVLGIRGDLQIVQTGVLQMALAVVALLPVIGMAWGVLRYKVVDLEEGLRASLSRGFVGATMIIIFFVATEAAETVLSGAFGPVIGLAAAGALALAVAPLERAGRRFASRFVPEPEDPASHRASRSREVYRATFEEATADGSLTARERRTLASLADSLGLSDQDVARVEDEVRRERAGGSHGPGRGPAPG